MFKAAAYIPAHVHRIERTVANGGNQYEVEFDEQHRALCVRVICSNGTRPPTQRTIWQAGRPISMLVSDAIRAARSKWFHP